MQNQSNILNTFENQNVCIEEQNFIDIHSLEEYNPNKHSGKNATILYFRSIQKNFLWYNDKDLITSVFFNFYTTGHSISIDYTKTYKRKAAWDIDCLCRKYIKPNQNTSHVSDDDINKVVNIIKKLLNEIIFINLKKKKFDIQFSVWKNKCGHHIYTNVDISLPLHIHLTTLLKNEIYNLQMVAIELPTYMPLPYSSKILNLPYSFSYGIKDFVFNASKSFIEIAKITQNLESNQKICSLNVFEKTIIIEKSNFFETEGELFFPNNKNCVAIEEYNKLLTFFENTKVNYSNDLNLDLGLTEIPCVEFIKNYTTQKYENPRIDWTDFINNSVIKYGTLYLQHYVMLFYKFVEKNYANDLIRFKTFLKNIYSDYSESIPTIGCFIEKFDDKTIMHYDEIDYDEFMHYLILIDVMNIGPFEKMEEVITKYVKITTGCEKLEEIFSKKSSNMSEDFSIYLNAYVDALHIFKFILNNNNNNWLILKDNGHYECLTKPPLLPCFPLWCGQMYKSNMIYINHFVTNHVKIQDNSLWSPTNFFLVSSIGVFNSIVQLYSAPFPWFRYSRSRAFILNVNSRKKEWHNSLNEENYDMLNNLSYIFLDFPKKIEKIFHLYQVAPALLDLSNCSSFSDFEIYLLLSKLPDYNGKDLDFLFDYYPVDLKFLTLCLHFYQSYNLEVITNYERLISAIWSNSIEKTEEEWKEQFESKLNNIKFKESDNYLTQVASLKSDLIQNFSKQEIFHSLILSLCYFKNIYFSTICNAFHFTFPQPIKINQMYQQLTTVNHYRELLKKVLFEVFGSYNSELEKNCINLVLKLAMSCNFNYESLHEYLCMYSSNFTLDNLLKVFYVLIGPKDTGKTYASKILKPSNDPFFYAMLELKNAVARSSLHSLSTIIFINELKDLSPSLLKSITGNDLSAGTTFHSQTYRNFDSTSTLIAATNEIPDFNTQTLDITSVDRMHAINLNGVQIKLTKSESPVRRFIKNQYISNVVQTDEKKDSHSLVWVSYLWYLKTKSDQHYPEINFETENSINFRHEILMKNSRLYRFLQDCGLIFSRNVFFPKKTLFKLAKENVEQKNQIYSTMKEFTSDFFASFSDLKDKQIDFIPNLIEKKLLDHIKINFHVKYKLGSKIPSFELHARAKAYSDKYHVNTVLTLFSTQYDKYYNKKTLDFENIEFVYERQSYLYNVAQQSIFTENIDKETNFMYNYVRE